MVDLCPVVKWSSIWMVVWKLDWKSLIMVHNVQNYNGPPSHMTLPLKYRTPSVFSVNLVCKEELNLLYQTGYSRTNRTNNMIIKLRGEKIPTVRGVWWKLPLLPKNVGKRSWTDNRVTTPLLSGIQMNMVFRWMWYSDECGIQMNVVFKWLLYWLLVYYIRKKTFIWSKWHPVYQCTCKLKWHGNMTRKLFLKT